MQGQCQDYTMRYRDIVREPEPCCQICSVHHEQERLALATKLEGGRTHVGKTIHITPINKYPQVAALTLPTNVVNINEAEMGRFSPLRVRDISGPVINAYNLNRVASKIDITVQPDPHVNKYDCRGAVSLSSSMQSNVPSPFSGNKTHLNMPGSQWGQGHKYLSDHLHSAHYLTLRNEYRGKLYKGIFHNY